MEELIHNYLTKNYKIDDLLVDLIIDIKTGKTVWCIDKEINTIFNIDIKKGKTIINDWGKKIKPDICLEFYWDWG